MMTRVKAALLRFLLLVAVIGLTAQARAAEDQVRKACYRIAPTTEELQQRKSTKILCRTIYFDRNWYPPTSILFGETVTFSIFNSENEITEGPEQLPFQQKLVLKSSSSWGDGRRAYFYADYWAPGSDKWKTSVEFHDV